jgi:hypothetical protein
LLRHQGFRRILDPRVAESLSRLIIYHSYLAGFAPEALKGLPPDIALAYAGTPNQLLPLSQRLTAPVHRLREAQFASLLRLALISPEPRRARRRAQFLLRTGDGERTLEIRFCFARIRARRRQYDFASQAVNLSHPNSFASYFHSRYRLIDVALSLIESAKHCMSLRQI